MKRLSRTNRRQKRRRSFIIQLFFILCSIIILIFIPAFPSAFILEQAAPLHIISSTQQQSFTNSHVEPNRFDMLAEEIEIANENTTKYTPTPMLNHGEQLHAKYKQVIQQWINQISRDSNFDIWSFAEWSSYVIKEKDDSKIWAILGTMNEIEVGYIIVEELTGSLLEDPLRQLSLREYGLNERDILSRYIEEYHSFDSFDYAGVVWSQYVEEELYNLFFQATYDQVDEPHHSINWSGHSTNQLIQQNKLLYNELIQPLAILPQQKQYTPNSSLEEEPYFYYTQLSKGKNAMFPIRSVHLWNVQNEATSIQYFAIENEGFRFFPEEYLQNSGQIISFDRSIFDENTF